MMPQPALHTVPEDNKPAFIGEDSLSYHKINLLPDMIGVALDGMRATYENDGNNNTQSIVFDSLHPLSASSYIFAILNLTSQLPSRPDFFEIDMEVLEGELVTNLISVDNKSSFDVSQKLKPSDGRQKVYINAHSANESTCIIFRANSNSKCVCRIFSLRAVTCHNHEARVKLLKSQAPKIAHWYYDADLGNGVHIRIPNRSFMESMMRSRDCAIRMIEERFGALHDMTILDVACSGGFHSIELARKGAHVLGIDSDPNAVAQARYVSSFHTLKGRVEFLHKNVFELNLPPQSVDFIYCSGLFYHLREPILLAQLFKKWTRRGVFIQSSIINEPRDLLVLGDSAVYSSCASWEFALVPTSSMLVKMFDFAGFKDISLYDVCRGSISETKQLILSPPIPAPYHLDETSTGPVFLLASA